MRGMYSSRMIPSACSLRRIVDVRWPLRTSTVFDASVKPLYGEVMARQRK